VIVLLLGPPGSGKGTQGERLARLLGVPKIATGDVLRDAAREGTPLGAEAKRYMDRGDLVPDSVILGIVRDVFASDRTARGAILDGVVRTVPQAKGLETLLSELGRQLDTVLIFEINDDQLVERMSGRVVCESCQTPYTGRMPDEPCEKCGGRLVRRSDDEPEAVRNRLRVYRDQTAPVVDWYEKRGNGTKVHHIDAGGFVDEVTSRALKVLL
jgi:adenylate kinase